MAQLIPDIFSNEDAQFPMLSELFSIDFLLPTKRNEKEEKKLIQERKSLQKKLGMRNYELNRKIKELLHRYGMDKKSLYLQKKNGILPNDFLRKLEARLIEKEKRLQEYGLTEEEIQNMNIPDDWVRPSFRTEIKSIKANEPAANPPKPTQEHSTQQKPPPTQPQQTTPQPQQQQTTPNEQLGATAPSPVAAPVEQPPQNEVGMATIDYDIPPIEEQSTNRRPPEFSPREITSTEYKEKQAERKKLDDFAPESEVLLSTERTEVGETMKSAPFVSKTPLAGDTINKGYILDFGNVKALFKPASEEDYKAEEGEPDEPMKRRATIDAGTQNRREVACSALARMLGMGHLVPETVFRNVEGQNGSVQHWIEGTQTAASYLVGPNADPEKMWGNDEDLAMLAAFDYITCNQDRHMGNWLVPFTGIDDGLTFPNDISVLQWASFNHMWILKRAAYQTPLQVPAVATTWAQNWEQISAMLKEAGIGDEAVALAEVRVQNLAKHSGKSFGEAAAVDGSGKGLLQWFEDNDYMLSLMNKKLPKESRRMLNEWKQRWGHA